MFTIFTFTPLTTGSTDQYHDALGPAPSSTQAGCPSATAPACATAHRSTRGTTSQGIQVQERMTHISDLGGGRDRELLVSGLRSRIEHVLDMARDAFVETDARGVLTEWNRQSEVLFGWSRDEVLGRVVTEFLVPERYQR